MKYLVQAPLVCLLYFFQTSKKEIEIVYSQIFEQNRTG